MAHDKDIWQYDAYDEQICMESCNNTAISNSNFIVVPKMFEGDGKYKRLCSVYHLLCIG